MKVEHVTISIPISLSNVEVPDGTDNEKWEAIYAAAMKEWPEWAYIIRKYGVITACSDENLIE
jgi:hypothetical protein